MVGGGRDRNSYGLSGDMIQGVWVNWWGPIQQSAEVLPPALVGPWLASPGPWLASSRVTSVVGGSRRQRGRKRFSKNWKISWRCECQRSVGLQLLSPTTTGPHCSKISLDSGRRTFNSSRLETEGRSFSHSMQDLFWACMASLIFSSFSSNQSS